MRIHSSFDPSSSELGSTIQLLIKAHKAQGAVKPRVLHTCAKSVFGGLEAWLGHAVGSHLKTQAPHILESVEGFSDLAKTLVLPAGHFFCRLDVANFFTRGFPSDFTDSLKQLKQ